MRRENNRLLGDAVLRRAAAKQAGKEPLWGDTPGPVPRSWYWLMMLVMVMAIVVLWKWRF